MKDLLTYFKNLQSLPIYLGDILLYNSINEYETTFSLNLDNSTTLEVIGGIVTTTPLGSQVISSSYLYILDLFPDNHYLLENCQYIIRQLLLNLDYNSTPLYVPFYV